MIDNIIGIKNELIGSGLSRPGRDFPLRNMQGIYQQFFDRLSFKKRNLCQSVCFLRFKDHPELAGLVVDEREMRAAQPDSPNDLKVLRSEGWGT